MNRKDIPVFERLTDKLILTEAWQVIQKKKSMGGIDQQTIESFEKRQDKEIYKLSSQLKSGTYVPQPYVRINISKPGKPGEFRPLSLPAIRDKIVQQALKNLVDPYFNKLFLNVSYAYRSGKGAVKAINRIRHIIDHSGNKWACRADIDRFFDTMNHETALAEFKKIVDDPEVLKLLTMWINIGAVKPAGTYIDTAGGIAQGGIISPLLSNIYLHTLDQFIVGKGLEYVRYADNIIFFSRHFEQLCHEFDEIKTFLKNKLGLVLNDQKKYFFKLEDGVAFMGIFFKHNLLFMDHKRKDRLEKQFKHYVNTLLCHNRALFTKRLKEKIEGIEHYYGSLGMEHMYPSFNTHLQQCTITCLVRYFNKINKKPRKKEIQGILSEIRLFGDPFGKSNDEWVNEVSKQCLIEFAKKIDRKSLNNKKNDKRTASQLVSRQKAKYQKLENINREICIEEFGVFVGKTKTSICVKKKGVNILSVPVKQISAIDIKSKGITLSSDVIAYCTQNNISLFFSDFYGVPYCVLNNLQYGDSDLGLLQLKALQDGVVALDLVKEIVIGKIRNQVNVLKFYTRSRAKNTIYNIKLAGGLKEFKKIISRIKKLSFEEGQYTHARNQMMGFEAAAAKQYWYMVKILVADEVPDYPGRRRKGAVDLVNSLLNYGYGFLYRQIWKEVVHAKLNPKIGFLHAPSGEKPVLVYDLIEEFRAQGVDKVVLSMITKKEKMSVVRESGLLTDKTRHKLIEALLERQGTAVRYRGEKVLLKNIIKNQIRDVCRYLRGEAEYRCFIGYY